MNKVYLINAKRTAIGKFLGSFYEQDVVNVCNQLITNGFSKEKKYFKDIDGVIVGNVYSAMLGQNVARQISISCGIPESVPAYSVNMVCGSGMQAIIIGVNEIKCGKDLMLCGGIEFMSNIPFATNSYIRLGKKFGDFKLVDLMTHDGLIDAYSGVHMGITAENIAKKYKISRKDQDEYSYIANQRAITAIDNKTFNDEIVGINLKDYKGNDYYFDTDEHPNRQSTKEKIASLKPTFIKDGTGTVTAASSSGINDGASFVLLASEKYCKKHNIKPIAEVIASSSIGLDPQYMGLGPYYAIKKSLSDTKISFNDIDYFEINEAFAAQTLGCIKLLSKEYKVKEQTIIDKCNIYGSGLGLGHPLGATGARIVTTLTTVLKNKKAKYGIASLCVGGGQGVAILLKRK